MAQPYSALIEQQWIDWFGNLKNDKKVVEAAKSTMAMYAIFQ
jgi:hypothetical protein